MKKNSRRKTKIILIVFSLTLGVALLSAVFLGVKKFFRDSKLFLVEDIKTNLGKDSIPGEKDLGSLLGTEDKSLFSLNLSGLSSKLRKEYPQYREIVIQREFPQTLYINFIEREPFFQMNIGGSYYLVDKSHIVIAPSSPQPFKNKIIVHTLLSKKLEVSPGSKIIFPYSRKVNSLIEELYSHDFFQSHQVTSLYAFSVNDIWFDLDGIEIRAGNGGYKKKVKLLIDLILPRFKNDLAKIKYIDLRFKDYVVGYKR